MSALSKITINNTRKRVVNHIFERCGQSRRYDIRFSRHIKWAEAVNEVALID